MVQFKFSLRQIKCLLERIKRFCLKENYKTNGLRQIPVIYILISYIIPQLTIGRKLPELLKEFDKIMGYNNLSEIMEFITSEVKIESSYNDKSEEIRYLKKGKIYLKTKMNKDNLPQVMMQIYFWLRMSSCDLKDESPSEENLLLSGPTSYKEHILNEWLNIEVQKDKVVDTLFLTKNTEIENLIGASSLDDERKLEVQIKNLIDKTIFYFQLEREENELDEKEDDISEEEKFYKKKLEIIKKNIKNKKNKKKKECLAFIYECILNLQNLKEYFKKNTKNQNQIGLRTVTSFNLGIIPTNFIFGKKLILKGIEHPEPSVIERLNPLLENPRYLILTEDNQEIYNNDIIFRKIYKNNKKSFPLNQRFSLFFTSREVFHGRLSEAFLSRCTIINCPNYDNENYLTIKLNPEENYKIICKNIIENENLEKEIFFFIKYYLKKRK